MPFMLWVGATGEVLEWLKRHAWKACIRLKCIAGSNPALSAECEISIQMKQIYNICVDWGWG